MIGLNVEPGASCAWIARLIIGWSGLFMISAQSARLDTAEEAVGIVRRPADHGEHLAVAGIERHHRAAAAIHRQFGDRLQIQIEGQLQVFAGHRFLDAEQLPLAAAVVHQHLALAVDSTQRVVVLPLDAVLADHVARVVPGEFGGIRVPAR